MEISDKNRSSPKTGQHKIARKQPLGPSA